MKVPLLKFVGSSGFPLLNFEGPGVPLLNFRVFPGPTFKLWGEGGGGGGPGVQGPGVLGPLFHHAQKLTSRFLIMCGTRHDTGLPLYLGDMNFQLCRDHYSSGMENFTNPVTSQLFLMKLKIQLTNHKTLCFIQVYFQMKETVSQLLTAWQLLTLLSLKI